MTFFHVILVFDHIVALSSLSVLQANTMDVSVAGHTLAIGKLCICCLKFATLQCVNQSSFFWDPTNNRTGLCIFSRPIALTGMLLIYQLKSVLWICLPLIIQFPNKSLNCSIVATARTLWHIQWFHSNINLQWQLRWKTAIIHKYYFW